MTDTILLLVSTDETREQAEQVLRSHAYDIVSIEDGSAAVPAFHAHRPVAVVVDAHVHGANGLEVCRRLRAVSDVPVIMLTEGTDEVDELLAFAVGADDCLTGEFSPKRLAARVDAVVRRQSGSGDRSVSDVLGFGPILVRRNARTVTVHDTEILLTRTEFGLLCLLMEQPDHVINRGELMHAVWGSWHGDDHVIEVHLSRLRNKILNAGGPRIGEPVRGVGYRLGGKSAQRY